MRAWNLTRRDHHYRHDAFSEGLKNAGFDVRDGAAQDPQPGDVLLIWNRYGSWHHTATHFERAGGTVIVAENGYIKGRLQGGEQFAMAIRGHNGSGIWPTSRGAADPARWSALDIELKPWREGGTHILLAPNRPFGMPGLAMPSEWPRDARHRLERATRRPVRLRQHPGNTSATVPLEEDLRDCFAVVIWASSVGVHALLAGVPVICESPHWICKPLAGTFEQLENPPTPDRVPGLARLAWAQWHLDEIRAGEAFRELLKEPIG